MTLISKATGVMGLASCVYDMHKCGLKVSNNERAKASGNSFLSHQLGTMKTDGFSYKNAQIKNWYAKNNFLQPFAEVSAAVSGYLKGFFTAGTNYLPNLALSVLAIFTKKHKKIANIAAVGLAGLELANFLGNTVMSSERTDYLKM